MISKHSLLPQYTDDDDAELHIRASKILIHMGIPPCSKGYEYLRRAIIETYHSPDATEYITKSLYPRVARICRASSVTGIGRSCQRAIECAYQNSDVRKYFGGDKPPSCAQFISAVANHLHRSVEKNAQAR